MRETDLNDGNDLSDTLTLETPEQGVSPLGHVRLVRQKEDDVVGSLGAVEDRVQVSRGRDEELERRLEPRRTAEYR